MEYAAQNKAMVKFSVDDYDYESEQVTKKGDNDFLSMGIKHQSRRFFRTLDQGVQLRVFAHFEINHWYFWRLHCAISCADRQLIKRLAEAPRAKSCKLNPVARIRRGAYVLDREYQLQALQNMLSCKHGVPYLLLGPFGTGKTYVLAAAIDQLLKNPQNRILVCTHQNTGADKLYLSLQENLHAVETARLVLRLVPDDQGVARNTALMHPYSCKAVRNISIRELSKWPAIITTFSTALAIKDKYRREGDTLHFSNIIIDEGAQSREPEALGALVLADPDTHIVIAGDHRQVCTL